nr:IgX/IgW heavy chain long form [Protopterus aethiopicus]
MRSQGFLFLLCWLQCVRSDIVLSQSAAEVKPPGQSLKLKCAVTGFDVSSYYMSWVKQAPGKGFEWIVSYYDSNPSNHNYNPTFQSRFSASKDSSNFYLQMNNLQVADTSVYYCARQMGYFDAWGPGTYVTVTSATPSGPSVYPVSPCCDVQKSQDPLKIGCFVTADSPSDNIQWFLGSSQISSGVTQYPEVYSNGRYSLSSVLNLKSADWNDKSYECRFGTQKKPVQKRGCKEDCPNKIPKIELYMASCEPDDPKNMYLFCDLSDFAPEDIEVAWFRGTSTVTDFITIGNVTEVNKCSFHTSSKLKLVPEDWSNGMEYKCLATHSTKSVEKKISSCTACPKPSPTIELMKSSYRDFFTKKKGTLTCNVTSFLKNTIVILKQDNRDLVKKQLSSSEATGNGTWNVHISFDISEADWRKTFICEAQHTCKTDKKTLNPEETKEQKKPSVKIHKAVSSIFNTLICIISGYYPDEIFVKWEQNGHPGNTEASTHPAVYDKASKSYTMQSILLIPIEDVKEASIWSCMVGHSALSEMMSDSTEVKPFAQPKVPPTVAISEPSADENNEQRLNIDCIAYGFFPKNIAIQWLSQEPKKLLVKTFDVELGESGTYSIKSILNLSKEEWHEGQFTCDVKHEATKTRILRNTTNTHACSEYMAAPDVYTIKPSYEDIVINRKATLTCLVVGYELDSVNITWTENDSLITDGISSNTEIHSNGTETVKGLLGIPADDWLNGRKYSCKVAHSALPTPKLMDMWFEEGSTETKSKTRAPEVNLRLPTPEEVKKDENLTLICLIENYFPDYVFVQWRENNTRIHSSNYRNSDSYFNQKTNAYTMDSKLVVQTKDWDEGKTYTCMVNHISSTWTIFKEGNKHTGKPTTVNLSVYLTEGKRECHV